MTEPVWPAAAYLDGFRDALARGWSPDSMRGVEAARDELADPSACRAAQVDREASGAPIALPNGGVFPRLPGDRRWIRDDGFVGHVIVPWKQGRGHATRALVMSLDAARDEGLPHVLRTIDSANRASRRVIEHNGG